VEEQGTVLIVDDDPGGRKVLEALLAASNLSLCFAENGPDCLARVLAEQPDLILLDVMMPEMDGFEVCRRLRADETIGDVPILLLTALDDRDSRLAGLEAGADDFITKPFDRTELRSRVRTIMRLNRTRKLREEHARLQVALESLEAAHDSLKRAYDQTIEGWVGALDIRDKETEGHTHRVTAMTLDIAKLMGIRDEALEHVRRGALLHDIGKLGIPDSILYKGGTLTDEEMAAMRLHTIFAHDWLSGIEYLRPALEIPYSHHERWDGNGYPLGLQGEEIPLAARCFAVVDVWDALTHERTYKRAWTEEEALQYVIANRGAHFDPQVVDVFVGVIASRALNLGVLADAVV
jgi:putative two-component system response regulator